jgi:Dockerin type I domain
VTSLHRILAGRVVAALLIPCVLLVAHGSATSFFDDISATNGGSDAVSGTNWIAGSFTTDTSKYSTITASLLLQQTSSSSPAVLNLYSNGGLQPGSLVGTFTSPTSFSTSSLASTSFTLNTVTLAASTTYWLVLHSTSGSYNWGWTSDFTVMNDWASSSNSGSVWFGDNAYPYQYKVSGVVGDYNGNGTVDAADYVVWRRQQGTTASGLAADGNGDGTVNTADYTIWRTNYSVTSSGSGAGSGLMASAAVPEPISAALAGAALLAMTALATRRMRSKISGSRG